MLGKFIDKFLHEEEELLEELEDVEKKKKKVFSGKDVFFALLIFLVAVALRLYFLYFVSDPQNAGDGWYGDTYHHWQIGYLSGEIGLHKRFLRLWDLKGMEYFWGPIHPLLLTILFGLTGSASIVIPRIMSAVFGAVMLSLLYLLCVKYWNRWVGLAAAFLGVVNPVAIFNDASGMLEPIGYALLLLGILLVEASPGWAGFVLALATMVRAEAWIFSLALLVLAWRVLKRPGDLAKLLFAFIIPMIVYMKYLLDHTGDAIYPVWWNYLANARGAWAGDADPYLTSYQIFVRPFLLVWFGVSVMMLVLTLWRRWRGGLLLTFGFLTWAFYGGFFGLTHYLKGFEPWFWYIRFFVFPYIFLGLIISIFLFYIIPKLHKRLSHTGVFLALVAPIVFIAVVMQIVWAPILHEYHRTDDVWKRTKMWGIEAGQFYEGGRVLIPEGYPSFTYSLVYFGGVEGKNILGQMFDPFYYMEERPFENWGENRKVVLKWIKDEDIRLVVVDPRVVRVGPEVINKSYYLELIEKEPKFFEKVGGLRKAANTKEELLVVYKVFPEKIELTDES